MVGATKVLIVALPDLANRVSRYIKESVAFVVKTDTPSELRHRVHSYQPNVVVLDYRMGGSAWRAIDEVPAIVSRTASTPRVIVVLPWRAREVDEQAADLDCYDIVSAENRDFDEELAEAVESALRSSPGHQALSRRVSRDDLH
jgi:DNA-binding NarL/FixJ family response regulator